MHSYSYPPARTGTRTCTCTRTTSLFGRGYCTYSYRMPPTTRCDFVRFLLSQSLPVQGQQNGTWDRRILRPRARTNERASRMRGRAPVRPRPQALAVSRPVSACAVSPVGRAGRLSCGAKTSGREDEDEPEASPSCGSSSERHPNPQPSRTHSMLQKREKSEP